MTIRTKILITLFLSLATLVFIVIFTPKVIRFDVVQSEIIARLGRELESDIRISDIRWHWLPFPYVSVQDAHVDNEHAIIIVPQANLYPDWKSLFSIQLKLGKIELKKPSIQVKTLKFIQGDKTTLPLPQTTIIVRNGDLKLTAKNVPGIKNKEFHFTSINSIIHTSPEKIRINLHALSSFAKGFSLEGSFDIPENSYRFKFDCKGLRLHESVTSFAEGRIIPVESIANLQGTFNGQGVDLLTANLFGEFPCFAVKPEDKKYLITCGFADLSLTKTGDTIDFLIKELELKEPGLILSGKISRNLADNGENLWGMDFNAKELNLTEIRNGVLTLWGDNSVAKEVCAIVLGGKANNASYRFSGSAEDFKNIKAMTITADIESAPIHVPGAAALDLTEAKGEITIKNGRLSGRKLSAKLDNSFGSNCSLLVGLAGEDDSFQLDLDIDADLAGLPPVLHRLVGNSSFKEELSKFSEVAGRAVGHLIMGDTFHDIWVKVAAKDIKATANYDRLRWPVAIRDGTLRVLPDKVTWEGVSGNIGVHIIQEFTGSALVRDDAYLDVKKLQGTFDGATLYDELADYPSVQSLFAEAVSEVRGPLKISNMVLQGPAWFPDQWKYSLNLYLDDVTVTSPLLDGSFLLRETEALINEKKVNLSKSKPFFHNQSLQFSGQFQHSWLKNWKGWLEINGVVHESLAEWVKTKDWVPPLFFPKFPASLHNLKLSWSKDYMKLSGKIVAGAGEKQLPMVQLDIRSFKDDSLLVDLDITGHDEQAGLTVDLLDNIPETFLLVWQGTLSADTVNAVLEHEEFLSGQLNGNFKVKLAPQPTESFFEGDLEGNNLRWHWNDEKHVELKNLALHGLGNRLEVERLTLGFQTTEETVTAQGFVSPVVNGLDLELELASPALSQKTISEFLDGFQTFTETITAEGVADAEIKPPESGWDITGKINFAIDEFKPDREVIFLTEDPAFTWRLLEGQITLHPQGKITSDITSANLCCMDTTGIWYSDKSLGEGHLNIKTACPTPVLFQEAFSCLGIEQDVIEGEFSLNATLYGEPGQWNSGKLVIHSPQGRILRMRLLSKIFSVINLTDLFSGNGFPEMDEKGFAYSKMDFEAHIEKNELIIDKAVIRGKGLNLFGKGRMNLSSFETDSTILIAPFKTLDALVTNVPLIGRVFGGENATLITIPVGVKGDIRDPKVTVLPPSAVGEGILNLVKNTLLLPFNILSPILPGN